MYSDAITLNSPLGYRHSFHAQMTDVTNTRTRGATAPVQDDREAIAHIRAERLARGIRSGGRPADRPGRRRARVTA